MKCTKHPKYQVKRKPRCLCERCWEMWVFRKLLKEKFGGKVK